MPYMKLTSAAQAPKARAQIARELTDAVVRLMTPPFGRGLPPEALRERCTVHFTPYEDDAFAIGGRMMADRNEKEVTMEFADWGLNVRRQRRLAGAFPHPGATVRARGRPRARERPVSPLPVD